MDNGKLQQFNYSRSLITNRGTVERGKIHSARAMKQNDRHVDRLTDSVNMISNVQMTPWYWYSVQGLLNESTLRTWAGKRAMRRRGS